MSAHQNDRLDGSDMPRERSQGFQGLSKGSMQRAGSRDIASCQQKSRALNLSPAAFFRQRSEMSALGSDHS